MQMPTIIKPADLLTQKSEGVAWATVVKIENPNTCLSFFLGATSELQEDKGRCKDGVLLSFLEIAFVASRCMRNPKSIPNVESLGQVN